MTPLEIIRRKKIFRFVSAFMALNMLAGYFTPTPGHALTSGPGQEEFASFEPVSTSDMVDLYSGDFNYNIPLMSVPGPNGGYPINIAYHSGVGMDQEASWVGLGWNISVGAINRQMRGLPDDFNGDIITNRYSMRDNATVAVGFDVNRVHAEKLGIPRTIPNSATPWSTQLYYNTYKGLGYRLSVSFPLGKPDRHSLGFANAGLHFDSQSGIGFEPSFTIKSDWYGKEIKASLNSSVNTREGLSGFAFSLSSYIRKRYYNDDASLAAAGVFKGNSILSFGVSQGMPSAALPMKNSMTEFDLNIVGVAGQYTTLSGVELQDVPGSFENFNMSFWNGFVNVSSLDADKQTASYGYLYDGKAPESGLRDFQREQFTYNKKLPNLPTSNVTYDGYLMTGQGLGGYFRPYHQNVKVFSNESRENSTKYTRVNAEVGFDWDALDVTDEYHVGLGLSLGRGGTYSGGWTNIGASSDVLFADNVDDFIDEKEPLNEQASFKVFGEKTAILASTEDQLLDWDNDNAVRVQINKSTNDASWQDAHFTASSSVSDGTTGYAAFDFTSNDSWLHKDQRERRATNIEYFTADQALQYGFTHNIGYNESDPLQWVDNQKTYSGPAEGHHLSEISVLKPDGMRYVYGLAAYNTVQRDAYFSVQQSGTNFNTETVDVPDNGTDIDPSGTPDNFLSETEIPPFAHSWLLTAVVSADYLDLTGNGPSDDDYGYWVRFNYAKKSEDYRWRVPYADASFMVGNASDVNDDKASFSYGEKEIYYVQSIETKTHIAVFATSKREDGVSAADRLNGGRTVSPGDDQLMYKLDKISLYAKAEFFDDIANRELNPSPVPIQSANFRYSYDLCPEVPNNTLNAVDVNGGPVIPGNPADVNTAHGKLTLKKLFFTYETSSRGEFSPYEFSYDNANPEYNRKNMDRWGHYQDNGVYDGNYPYVDFPYTEQDSPPEAGVWSLSSIQLPTGARMNISYEPDDYQYVEDKHAQRMFDIVGTGESTPSLGFNVSRNGTPAEMHLETFSEMASGKFKLYFKLEHAYASDAGADKVEFFEKYLDNGSLDTVYFKTALDIKGIFGSYYDYVSGYARVSTGSSEYGLEETVSGSGDFDIGWITLYGEDLDDAPIGVKVHPFTKAGIEHVHYNRPDIAHTPVPQSPNALNQAVNLIQSVVMSTNDIYGMLAGYNNWAYIKGFSKKIRLNGWSVIRLQDPNQKYGGGDRVKELKLTDTWENGSAPENMDVYSYGQKYSYTLEDGTSSGVTYEPQIGGDESALRSPRPYQNYTPLKGVEHLFIENPLMESYYPGAGVGYSRVIVESIAPDQAVAESTGPVNKLLHTAAPISIYEFYTPKDFPVLVDETPITADPSIVRPVMIPGIYTNFRKQSARSQGYCVALNDMAGKLKSVEIRTRPVNSSPSVNTSGNLISRQRFIYNTEEPYSDDKVNRLSSKVQVMSCSAGVVQYQTALVGQSHDIFIDMNENREWISTVGMDFNLDLAGPAASMPTFVFLMPLWNVSETDARQRTVVVNKVVHRSGILKEVITTDHESTVKNTFIAFDKETGEPLLTKMTNEFNEDVYGFTYPAHWYYPAMQGAYKNFGVEISSATCSGTFPLTVNSNGRVKLQSVLPAARTANDYFTEGDQVWIDVASGTDAVYTIVKVGINGADEYIDCIDKTGTFISSSLQVESIRVIRSGYQNLQSIAAGSVASQHFAVTQYDEFTSTGYTATPTSVTIDETIGVLSAAAVEYADVWQTACKDCDGVTLPSSTTNPYRWGVRGKWRPLQSYAFVTQRTQNNNIAEDGVYTLFSQFNWTAPSLSDPEWTPATTVTKYSPNGFELENRDAIGNYSAALFEFGESVATAVASNARHKEIAFDSFEDYDYINSCNTQFDHWGFGIGEADITIDEHHTGVRSLKVSDATNSEAITSPLINKNCETYRNAAKRVSSLTDGSASTQYQMDTCDCVGKFSPITGKTYLLSAWVKETGHSTPPLNYTNAQIKVELLNVSNTVISTETFTASGPIIEGWQRVYGTFEVPAGARTIRVTYLNTTSTGEDCFFDDTRIHPFDANMVTYVYDPFSFRRVAELDANNFATFYVYNEEGQLSAVKKETTGGIKTLREGKTVLKPNNQ